MILHHSQRAIVLKKIPYSESDEIITALLKEGGVRRFYVRGSKKSQKRFAGALDLFNHVSLSYTENQKGLWGLHEASLVSGQKNFWFEDLQVYAFLNFFAEMICEFSPEGVVLPIYDLWYETLSEVQENITAGGTALKKAMALFGYERPWLQNADAGKEREEIVGFIHTILQKPLKSAEFFLQIFQNRLPGPVF